jgi:uncharacterized protein (DUF58 family)
MSRLVDDRAELLDPAFAARLDRLDLLSRKILSGKLLGPRPAHTASPAAAQLPVDYRDYTPGDDPRWIDWNLYARLDRLMLKLFAQEEELFVYLLVDNSASCDYGSPAKSLFIRQTAAALAYIGLANHHHVGISAMAGKVARESGLMRGRGRTAEMIQFLAGLKPAGRSAFAADCRRFAEARKYAGVCVVLSDFFFGHDIQRGLDDLRAARHDLFCIQVLAPQELDPAMAAAGDVELMDLEEWRLAQVSMTPELLRRYRENLDAHCRDVEQSVIRRGGNYVLVGTDVPFDRLVLDHLRRRGLVG